MMMRAVAACVASCLAVLLCGSVGRAQSVAFINPGKSDEVYWVTATQGMQAAARSLGMTFEVRYSEREPLKTFEIAREMVAREPGKRPDYIVITDNYSQEFCSWLNMLGGGRVPDQHARPPQFCCAYGGKIARKSCP